MVLAILLASMVVSMMRGLVREVLSLTAFAAAFVAAIWWGPWLYEALTPYIEMGLLRMAVGYLGVFVGVLLVVGTINLALGSLIKSTGLAPADRGLGAIFGLARGLLIIMILVVAAGYTPLPAEAWWKNAMLSNLSEQVVLGVKQQLPQDVGKWIPYPYQAPPAGATQQESPAAAQEVPAARPRQSPGTREEAI